MAAKPQEKSFLTVAHKMHLASGSVTRFKSSLRSGSYVSSKSQLTGSKVILNKPPPKPAVVIRNEEGVDVTPRPLLPSEGSGQNKTLLTSILYGGSKSDSGQRLGVQESGAGSIRVSFDASQFADPFSRSALGGSIVEGQQRGSMTGSGSAYGAGSLATKAPPAPILFKETSLPLHLQDKELDNDIAITLTETETMWMFEQAPTAMPADSEGAQDMEEKTAKYLELCRSRAGNDRYVQRGMQTINPALKVKDVQTMPVLFQDVGVMATTYDMYTTFSQMDAAVQDEAEDDDGLQAATAVLSSSAGGVTSALNGRSDSQLSVASSTSVGSAVSSMASSVARQLETPCGDLPVSKNVVPGLADDSTANVAAQNLNVDDHPVFRSPQLFNTMAIVERALALNNYQREQAMYRSLKPHLGTHQQLTEDEEPEHGSETSLSAGEAVHEGKTLPVSPARNGGVGGSEEQSDDDLSCDSSPRPVSQLAPHLKRLWVYSSGVTTGHNVSCFAWNKSNRDVLAVGYGQFAFGDDKRGLVCCWSIKNPEYPERTYKLPQGVMSVDFSHLQPCLLAAGMYDGTINIYNVQGNISEPIFSCSSAEKHTGPVWQVSFVKQMNRDSEEAEEMLVSISSDGRVSKWAANRGFEQSDLILLKQTSRRATQQARQTLHSTVMKESKRGDGLLMRHASGMCFDFEHKKDGNTYVVGTEEGYVHKCSVSYNEQYLETYIAHTGPVYRILWSPFHPKAFLTCSADWSVRLWHVDQSEPVDTFYTAMKAVLDIAWSPFDPAVFAAVSHGRIEVWDLTVTILDPVIILEPLPTFDLTFVEFAKNANVLMVGDRDGQVSVYQLCDMKTAPYAKQMQILDKILKGEMKTK